MRLGADTARNYRKQLRRRRLRSIVATVLVIGVLIVLTGLGYAWYTGQQAIVKEAPQPSVKWVNPADKAPPKPAANTPIGIAEQTFSSPVKSGENSSISVKTLPSAACSIMFTYNDPGKISKDSGLIPKTADEFGLVEWTWTVTADVPAGTWPVEVTCAHQGKSAYYRGDLVVEK